MFRSLAFLVGLLALAPVAHAEPVFDTFQKMCLATGGERTSALAAAEAAGWGPMPRSLLDQFTASKNDSTGTMTNADGRIRTDKDGMVALIVARSDRLVPAKTIPADVCAVARMPADSDALKSAASAYAAVPADPTVVDEKNTLGFIWRSDGAKHVALTAAEIEPAAKNRDASLLLVSGQDRLAMVALAVPAK